MEPFISPPPPFVSSSNTRLDLSIPLPIKPATYLTETTDSPVRIGDGNYSRVYSAKVKLKDPFGNEVWKSVAIKRNLISRHSQFTGSIREMDIHSRLRWHPFIVNLLDNQYGSAFGSSFTDRPPSPLNERKDEGMKDDNVHFYYELGLMDLFGYLYECPPEIKAKLPKLYLRKALMQMMLSIEFVHQSNVIHRDIKPANFILFSVPCYKDGTEGKEEEKELVFKLCDFGMSKPYARFDPNTPRVITWRYRPPEILLRSAYAFKADVWSMGCIIYEMLLQDPMVTLSDEKNGQETAPCEIPWLILGEIVKRCPFPITEEDKKIILQVYPNFVFNELGGDEKLLRDCIIDDEPILKDLLSKMLVINPKYRWTISQCLDHPYFNSVKGEIDYYRLKGEMPAQKWVSLASLPVGSRAKEELIEFLRHLYKLRQKFPWYTHRILYHTIDLACRYILAEPEKVKEMEKSELNFPFLVPFLVCLYLSLKYFIPTGQHLEFSAVVAALEFGEVQDITAFVKFEENAIEHVWKREIYRITDYETAVRPIVDADVEKLLGIA
jgi:serine/threonine protein kinase